MIQGGSKKEKERKSLKDLKTIDPTPTTPVTTTTHFKRTKTQWRTEWLMECQMNNSTRQMEKNKK